MSDILDVEAGGLAPTGPSIISRDEAERVVSSAWCELLAMDDVDHHRNFFDLGGDSLMLFALHNRLQDLLDREITLLDMLRFPTISSFAASLLPPETQPAREARPALVHEWPTLPLKSVP